MIKGKRLIAALIAAMAIAISATAIAQGSSSKQKASKASATQEAGTNGGRPPGMSGMGGGPGGPDGDGAVHSVSVVPDKAGTSFITLTSDRGTVQSVDGTAGTITLAEGTKSATYKTLTLTIPSEATVTLDGKKAALGEVVANDHVSVSASSEGTTVFATDSSFQPQGGAGKGGPGGHGPGGPPPGQEAGTETKSGSSSSAKSGTSTTTSE
jgi:hypothetical protein